jgi:hypothetical protein
LKPFRLALVAGAGLFGLAACSSEAPAPVVEETEIPDEIAAAPLPPVEVEDSLGTPLADRVATLGLINKRNNISREIEMKPGEARRIDDVIIRLASCERTPPWENPPLTGAFVQVIVQDRADAQSDPEWRRVFSGWLYKEAPAVNVVEHPVYDVWVKDCAMTFPGEEEALRRSAPSAGGAPAAAPAEPAAAPAPEAPTA